MVSISDRTYQQLMTCLQAHAPADAGARDVLETLQREVQSYEQPNRLAFDQLSVG